MCGIAGAAWTSSGEPLAEQDLRSMIEVLVHRGPDDWGLYHSAGSNASQRHVSAEPSSAASSSGPGAALGHRRLSIIDLGGGHQPLSNEDGTIWIAFNGEIYNYRELRPPLEAQGHQFRTNSDTETIVHLYEQYGAECVQHLRGMFAFAIWDETRGRLFLARDRIGQKPLVYRREKNRLLFASELKALLQLPQAPRSLDPRALDLYLTYQYVPHPYSILAGYRKLPPAHWATYQDGELTVERYWRPPYDQGTSASVTLNSSGRPQKDWQDELRTTLTEAVRLRMRSDVPLGAFLSGGIDSTIIAGLMQELSERPVHTFSIGFPVKQFDERAFARQAAQHLGTDHHEAVVEPAALEILPRMIWQYDEPFADNSAIPTMYLSEMTRKHVTVALSGDAGDELFVGYDRYRAVQIGEKFDRLPRILRKALTARIWQKLLASPRQKTWRRRLQRLLEGLAEDDARRYMKWICIFNEAQRRSLYSEDFRSALSGADAAEFILQAFDECPSRDLVTRTTCADVLSYLPCDILTKVDIASMAYGLEARSPFLDHRVVELAARIPLHVKITGNRWKGLLIDTFADLLPDSIQNRAKMGFSVPLDHWFAGELKPLLQEILLDPGALQRGYFDPQAVHRLVDEHTSGRQDHSIRIWTLLCFEMWHRTFLDPPVPPSQCPSSIVVG